MTAVLAEGIERVATFSEDPEFTVLFESSGEVSYMWLNTEVEAFQDARVRQAIAHAINRDEAIEVYDRYARPTCLMVVPYAEPYNGDYCPYEYDPETAKALLAEAGYENLEIDYPFTTVASHPFTMEVLTQQLGDVGITVNSRGQDLTTWIDQTLTAGRLRDERDPRLRQHHAIRLRGRARAARQAHPLCIPEFEDKLAVVDSILDEDEYLAAMSDLVHTFADLAWVTVISAPEVPMLMRADLEGIQEVRINNGIDLGAAHWAE